MDINGAKNELTRLTYNFNETYSFQWLLDEKDGTLIINDVLKDKLYYIKFSLRQLDDNVYIDFICDGFAISFDSLNFYTSTSNEIPGFVNWLKNFSIVQDQELTNV